jgi:hypothetical protein
MEGTVIHRCDLKPSLQDDYHHLLKAAFSFLTNVSAIATAPLLLLLLLQLQRQL